MASDPNLNPEEPERETIESGLVPKEEGLARANVERITLSRRDLVKKFQAGSLPDAGDFEKLITSTVNQLDDGFDKTLNDGLRISSLGSSVELLSLFKSGGASQRWDSYLPIWRVSHGESSNALHVRGWNGGGYSPVLTLDQQGDAGRVGINQDQPDEALHVAGTARMHGRRGRAGMVEATGDWRPICSGLEGCHAFEIMAGVGDRQGKGRYALLHAIAMSAHHPRGFLAWLLRKSRIKTHHAYYSSRCDRLRLRWTANKDNKEQYDLEIKTGCSYPDHLIQYEITELWFDPMLRGGRPRQPEADGSSVMRADQTDARG